MNRALLVVGALLFLGGVALATSESGADVPSGGIRVAEEGNAFAQLGIDCGPDGEAGETEYFGLGPAYETAEKAVTAEVGRMSDLDPAAAYEEPQLSTESTGASGTQRTYFLENGGAPVAVVTVIQKDEKWYVLGSTNCVAKG